MSAVTKIIIPLAVCLSHAGADEILQKYGAAGPEDAWAYLRVDEAGQRGNRRYIPTRQSLQRARFLGYVAYDTNGGWKKEANGVPEEDVIRLFCTYALSETNRKLRVHVGGDDGHAVYVDGVLLGSAGVGEDAVGVVEFRQNKPVYIELLGFNGPLTFQLTIDKFADTKGIMLNADGKFDLEGVEKPAPLKKIALFGNGEKKEFRWPSSFAKDGEAKQAIQPPVVAKSVLKSVFLPPLDEVGGKAQPPVIKELKYLTSGQFDVSLLEALAQVNGSTHTYSAVLESQKAALVEEQSELALIRIQSIAAMFALIARFSDGVPNANFEPVIRRSKGAEVYSRLRYAKDREKAVMLILKTNADAISGFKDHFRAAEETASGRMENNQILSLLGLLSDKDFQRSNRMERRIDAQN